MWEMGIGIILVLLGSFCVFEWHAKCIFMAVGYPRRYGHGKSWNRAIKHYKKNWSFCQRMLWIPVFKEHYESDFRFLAYFSYIHFISTIVTSVLVSVLLFLFFPLSVLRYPVIVYYALTLLRYIYTVYVLRNNYKKRSRFSEKRD